MQSCHLKAISLQPKQHFSSHKGDLRALEGRGRTWAAARVTGLAAMRSPKQDGAQQNGTGKVVAALATQRCHFGGFLVPLHTAEISRKPLLARRKTSPAPAVDVLLVKGARAPHTHKGTGAFGITSPPSPPTKADHLSTRKYAILLCKAGWPGTAPSSTVPAPLWHPITQSPLPNGSWDRLLLLCPLRGREIRWDNSSLSSQHSLRACSSGC